LDQFYTIIFQQAQSIIEDFTIHADDDELTDILWEQTYNLISNNPRKHMGQYPLETKRTDCLSPNKAL
jgi:hypothetical protein